jgi:hypothetical protein
VTGRPDPVEIERETIAVTDADRDSVGRELVRRIRDGEYKTVQGEYILPPELVRLNKERNTLSSPEVAIGVVRLFEGLEQHIEYLINEHRTELATQAKRSEQLQRRMFWWLFAADWMS